METSAGAVGFSRSERSGGHAGRLGRPTSTGREERLPPGASVSRWPVSTPASRVTASRPRSAATEGPTSASIVRREPPGPAGQSAEVGVRDGRRDGDAVTHALRGKPHSPGRRPPPPVTPKSRAARGGAAVSDLLARSEAVGEDRWPPRSSGIRATLTVDSAAVRGCQPPLSRAVTPRRVPPVGSRSAAVNEGPRPEPGDVGWPSARSTSLDDSGEPLSTASRRDRAESTSGATAWCSGDTNATSSPRSTAGWLPTARAARRGRVRGSRRERIAAATTSTCTNGAVRSPRGSVGPRTPPAPRAPTVI